MNTPNRGARLLQQWRGSRTQAAVAAILGIDQGRYSQLERGRRRPALKLALTIEERTERAVPLAAWIEEDAEAAAKAS